MLLLKKAAPLIGADYPVAQAPVYQDNLILAKILERLEAKQPIVDLPSLEALHYKLNHLFDSGGLLFQAGECAETFELMQPENINNQAKLISILGEKLKTKSGKEVIINSRMGGQFAKPRTHGYTQVAGELVQAYYGDLINGRELVQREPNPMRMVWGYQVIKRTMQTLAGMDIGYLKRFFTMHEAYHLPFEIALMRQQQKISWASTGHILWVGARTNHPKYAHVQFLKNVYNPIGVKISPTLKPRELQEILTELSPRPSPIMLILRLGCHKTAKVLPSLIKAVGNQQVFWILDPMHGNTRRLAHGKKTRLMNDMKQEIFDTAQILHNFDQQLSGIHLELTASKVLECVDNLEYVTDGRHFDARSMICDPRLNSQQAEELVDSYIEVLP